MRVLAVLATTSALLAPAPAPRQTCLAARSGIKTGTIMAEFEARQLAAMDRDEPPPFSAGDTVNVACEITEGTTKRIHPELRRRRHQEKRRGPDPDLHGAQDVVGHRRRADVSRLRAVGDEDRGFT